MVSATLPPSGTCYYQKAEQNDEEDRRSTQHEEENTAPLMVPLRGHITSFDGLRGIACLFAQLHHIEMTHAFQGHYGVSMFFVLSGFLISGILVSERAKVEGRRGSVRNYFTSFYTARAVRLLPAQLVVVFASYPWFKYMDANYYTTDRLRRAYLRLLLSMEDFKGVHHPLKNCWSLSVEEWSYVFLSLLIIVLPTDRRKLFIAIGLIALSFYAVKVYIILYKVPEEIFEWQKQAYFGFPPFNLHWELGFIPNAWKILLGAVFRLSPWPAWVHKCRKLSTILTLLLLCIIQYSGEYLRFRGYPWPRERSVLVDPIVALLTGFILITSLDGNYILDFPTLRCVGRISYSWYLWQWPIIDSINWGNTKWAKTGTTGVAFLFAHLSTMYVEEPVSRAYKAYRKRRSGSHSA